MVYSILAISLIIASKGYAILPNYDDGLAFENEMGNPVHFDIFKSRSDGIKSNVRRAQSKLTNEESSYSIDELSRKLHSSKEPIYNHDKATPVPVKTMKELEELMIHPTWLTDSSKKKVGELLSEKGRRVLGAQAPMAGQWYPKVDEEDREHIKAIITKFQTFKPKPITDNRITKFVFTHDGDLATSRTVQEHNKEVAAAFMDFNKKLEETLNARKKAPVMEIKADLKDEDIDSSFNRVVSFLNKNINKLRDDGLQHKQVCRHHKSHTKDFEYDTGSLDVSPINQNVRFNELARTRDGLESILRGLDRPRSGPFKRQSLKKTNKARSAAFAENK